MKKTLQIIKKAALDVYNAMKPCDFFFGKIESTAPYKLAIDSGCSIPEELLIFTDEVRNELNAGDKVIVFQKSGGQKFLILGRYGA